MADDKPMTKSVPLTIMIATQRITKLFPSNAPIPAVKLELPAVVCTPDNELAILCFDAGKTIKVIKGQRAREEVVGYLFADLLGIEVLPAEVLRLGENVRKAAVAAKDGESALKNGASAKKSRLKKKAEKDTTLASSLEAEIRDIESATKMACADLLEVQIHPKGLPSIDTAIVESRRSRPVAATAPESGESSTP